MLIVMRKSLKGSIYKGFPHKLYLNKYKTPNGKFKCMQNEHYFQRTVSMFYFGELYERLCSFTIAIAGIETMVFRFVSFP